MRNNIVMRTLEKTYPSIIKKLRRDWTNMINTDTVQGLNQDDYIMAHLQEEVEKGRESFQEREETFLMSRTASEFQVRNNPLLYKEFYPTGYENLDAILGGGLSAGITFVGAVSSLGKSTFCLNVAENLSEQGIPVLYFSMEMPRDALCSKLISKETYMLTPDYPGHAKTGTMLLSRDVMEKISDEEWKIIEQAARITERKTRNMQVLESQIELMSIDTIRKYVDMYMKAHDEGKKPVVIIDYLQLLSAPKSMHNLSDKQLADYTVVECRRMAAQYNIPIVVISSFNRESYSKKLGMQAFKESGGIEYSADVLLGMQFKDAGEKDFDIDKAKMKPEREIVLTVLKNRYGVSNFSIDYKFLAAYSVFEEVDWVEAPPGFSYESLDNREDGHGKEPQQLELPGMSSSEARNLIRC